MKATISRTCLLVMAVLVSGPAVGFAAPEPLTVLQTLILLPAEEIMASDQFAVLYVIPREMCSYYRIVDQLGSSSAANTVSVKDDFVERQYSFDAPGVYSFGLLLYDDHMRAVRTDYRTLRVTGRYSNVSSYFFAAFGAGVAFLTSILLYLFQRASERANKRRAARLVYSGHMDDLIERLNTSYDALHGEGVNLPLEAALSLDASNVVHLPPKVIHKIVEARQRIAQMLRSKDAYMNGRAQLQNDLREIRSLLYRSPWRRARQPAP